MKRANAVLFSLLMIVSSLAGCIGGEEVDTSEYEDQIAELEEMLEAQNQTIAQRDATIDGLEDGLSDATQMIQDHAEGIAILEAYRDSLLVQLENSNNTSAELIVQLDELEGLLNTANASILQWQQTAETNRANLSYAILEFTDLWESKLRYANLSSAELRSTNLRESDLTGANLRDANLRSADLTSANLRDANLRSADLLSADLTGADLTGADLTGAYLGSVSWGNTTCPDGTNSDNNGDTCVNNL